MSQRTPPARIFTVAKGHLVPLRPFFALLQVPICHRSCASGADAPQLAKGHFLRLDYLNIIGFLIMASFKKRIFGPRMIYQSLSFDMTNNQLTNFKNATQIR